MSFLVFITVYVVNTANRSERWGFHAIGTLPLEPRPGLQMSTPACGNFAQLTVKDVVLELNTGITQVECEEIDHESVSIPGPKPLSTEAVAKGIAQALKKAGWKLCTDGGEPLARNEPLVYKFMLIDPKKLRAAMITRGMNSEMLLKKVNLQNGQVK